MVDGSRPHSLSRGFVVVAILAASLSLAARPSSASEPSLTRNPGDPWRVISISKSKPNDGPAATIRFANGFSFRLGLFYPAVIGQLPSTGKAPFFIVEGSGCSECDATARSVYIVDPAAKPPEPGRAPGQWFAPFPSRNYSATDKRLMTWSRLYVGRCLADGRPTVVSFSARRETPSWKRTVDWVQSEGDHVVAHSAAAGTFGAPMLEAVRKVVRAGRCHEVPPQITDEGDF